MTVTVYFSKPPRAGRLPVSWMRIYYRAISVFLHGGVYESRKLEINKWNLLCCVLEGFYTYNNDN